MAMQNINIGNVANDGTGDSLREAFAKVNTNFTELDSRFAFTNTVENLGNGQGLFYTKENNVLYFKSIVAGDNITLSASNNEITISSAETFTIQSDTDSTNISGVSKFFGIKGSSNIDTNITNNDVNISIDPNGLLALDPAPTLSADLNINNHNITSANTVTAATFIGNLVGTVNGLPVTDYSSNLDLGAMVSNITSIGDYIIATTSIDYGSFITPASISSNFGSI